MSQPSAIFGQLSAFDPMLWHSAAFAGRKELVHAVTSIDLDMSLADAARGAETRRGVCRMLDLPFERLTVPEQVHGTGVAVVGPDGLGCGRDIHHPTVRGADGLLTMEVDVPLLVLSADCAPIAVYDPLHRAIGVAHAGWRGIVGGVIAELITAMFKTFDCRPSDCVAMIGPCAGACCYEIGTDVSDQLPRPISIGLPGANRGGCDAALQSRDGRQFLDLAAASATMLRAAGLRHDAIDVLDVCTICDTRFHSYRRQGRRADRNALILALRRV
ncbi:MAG: laccase domain-containing protein [Phycisphaerales bacterium]|nr:laccase domain-containing protein [Phycisphaerales bacterium]